MIFEDVILVVFLVTFVIAMFASSLVLFVIQYKRRHQMHLMETERLEQQYKAQLLETRLEVQEQSLKYFSEEIHDNIGQALTLVKLNLYEVKQLTKENEVGIIIEQGTVVLTKAIGDLRSISHRLNGDFVANEGIEKMLSKELEYLNSSKAITAVIDIRGDSFSLGPEKELMIFRIIQEAIANAVKHSGSRNIQVVLDYEQPMFTATVKDDGRGFEEGKSKTSGIGIINMRSRAELLKGKLDIFSKQDEGTIIQLQILTANET